MSEKSDSSKIEKLLNTISLPPINTDGHPVILEYHDEQAGTTETISLGPGAVIERQRPNEAFQIEVVLDTCFDTVVLYCPPGVEYKTYPTEYLEEDLLEASHSSTGHSSIFIHTAEELEIN